MLLDGKYTAGPHICAEWDADTQRFLPRHGNKAAVRQFLNAEFGGHTWQLVESDEAVWVESPDRSTRRPVYAYVVDFLFRGRHIRIRQPKSAPTPEQLCLSAALSSARPMLEHGGLTELHWHVDQSAAR